MAYCNNVLDIQIRFLWNVLAPLKSFTRPLQARLAAAPNTGLVIEAAVHRLNTEVVPHCGWQEPGLERLKVRIARELLQKGRKCHHSAVRRRRVANIVECLEALGRDRCAGYPIIGASVAYERSRSGRLSRERRAEHLWLSHGKLAKVGGRLHHVNVTHELVGDAERERPKLGVFVVCMLIPIKAGFQKIVRLDNRRADCDPVMLDDRRDAMASEPARDSFCRLLRRSGILADLVARHMQAVVGVAWGRHLNNGLL